jgi:DNA-binding response OmpR family regulator
MRILVIDDEERIAAYLVRGLQQDGHVVDAVGLGVDGLRMAARGAYALVVLDLMLPDLPGFDVLKQLRALRSPPAVLILSAKASLENRVRGLDLGADDCMAKPFSFSELSTRIRAIMRRVCPSEASGPQASTVRVAGFEVDRLKRQVLRGSEVVDLTPREFALLDYFIQNRGCPVTKRLIFENVWNMSADPQTNVVDVLVCRLRDKLPAGDGSPLIRTVRGIGYILDGDAPVAGSAAT